MRIVRCVGLTLVGLLLCSCGSSKTRTMTFADFRAKVTGMTKPYEERCQKCEGTGTLIDLKTGREVTCPECEGVGFFKRMRGPTLSEFTTTFGKPARVERKPGDLTWLYWYFPCKDGEARLPAYTVDEEGEPTRVMTDEPELVK